MGMEEVATENVRTSKKYFSEFDIEQLRSQVREALGKSRGEIMKFNLEILSSCVAFTGSIIFAHGFFIKGMSAIKNIASTRCGSNPFVTKNLYYGKFEAIVGIFSFSIFYF